MIHRDNIGKIILFGSLGLMSLVLLITSSIWMNGFKNDPFHDSSYDKAATSVAFAVIGIVVLVISSFLIYKNGIEKISMILLALTFLILFIGFVVPMDNQKVVYTNWTSLGSPSIQSSSAYMAAAIKVFPAALTFLLVPGLAFIGSSIYVAKEEMIF